MENFPKPIKTFYAKEPATISNQLKKLKQRGLIINDEKFAEETLTYVNYYRLVHYFSVFLDDTNAKKRYRDGTTFEAGLRLYDFDRRLRNALLIILEEIEVSVRAAVSNYHALKYGALGYLNASAFDRVHKHQTFLNKIEYMVESNKSEDFVRHYKNKYNGAFPLWVIMELFSFGTLTYFYLDMKAADKKELAERYFSGGGVTSRHLDSWLECLSVLRNNCAHYNRLYANNLNVNPRALHTETIEINQNGSLFDLVLIMKLLHKRLEFWRDGFVVGLSRLFTEYGDVADLSVMGFPENWEEVLRGGE